MLANAFRICPRTFRSVLSSVEEDRRPDTRAEHTGNGMSTENQPWVDDVREGGRVPRPVRPRRRRPGEALLPEVGGRDGLPVDAAPASPGKVREKFGGSPETPGMGQTLDGQ
eukprot:gene14415-biopygen5773